MRVTSLHVERSSRLTELSVRFPTGLTILIGKNSTGKSEVLATLAALAGSVPSGTFDVQVDERGKETTYRAHEGRWQGVVPTFPPGAIASLRDQAVIPPRSGAPAAALTREGLNASLSALQTAPQTIRRVFAQTLAAFFPRLELVDYASLDSAVVQRGVDRAGIDDLGAGFQQVFAILAIVFDPRSRLLLVDEPEAHLHPSVIVKLREVLSDTALRFGKQVIVATHSPLFLTPRLLRQTLSLVRRADTIEAYGVERGALDTERLEQELTAAVGEAFFADAVLMVEGVADRLLVRSLLDRFGDRSVSVCVIEVGGKGNLQIYRDLFAAFGIQYFTLLDADAMERGSCPFVEARLVKLQAMNVSRERQIELLRQQRIYVLPHGSLEAHYPRQYQRHSLSKPLAALHAGQRMTEREYNQEAFELKRVIEAIPRSLTR